MAVYRASIAGMQDVLLRASSKPKALEQLVTLEALSSEEMADALAAGEAIFKPGDSVKAVVAAIKPGGDAAEEERRPTTLEELAGLNPGCAFRVDKASGMVQKLPEGADSESGWEDLREATPEEIEAAAPLAAPKTSRTKS